MPARRITTTPAERRRDTASTSCRSSAARRARYLQHLEDRDSAQSSVTTAIGETRRADGIAATRRRTPRRGRSRRADRSRRTRDGRSWRRTASPTSWRSDRCRWPAARLPAGASAAAPPAATAQPAQRRRAAAAHRRRGPCVTLTSTPTRCGDANVNPELTVRADQPVTGGAVIEPQLREQRPARRSSPPRGQAARADRVGAEKAERDEGIGVADEDRAVRRARRSPDRLAGPDGARVEPLEQAR